LRALGLDLGDKRIGVATSDASGTLASPHSVVVRSGDTVSDRAALARLVADTGASVVVVGLPLHLSGRQGASAEAASAEAGELAEVLGVPVLLHDERLTTVEAARLGRASGSGRRAAPDARRRTKGHKGAAASPIDARAAAVLLQSWLDSSRGRAAPARDDAPGKGLADADAATAGDDLGYPPGRRRAR